MSDFTNEELVTLRNALNAWAVGCVSKAAYNWHAADLNYVLMGGNNKNVEACQKLIERIDAELEQRKGATCNEASK